MTPAAFVQDRWTGQVPVSFLVSFAYVQSRSARTTEDAHSRSRTLLTFAELSPADLESVLGGQRSFATVRERPSDELSGSRHRQRSSRQILP